MSEQSEKVEIQCTRVKQELYKLRELVEAIPHPEDQREGLKMFDRAYGDLDVLQTFIKSR